MKAHGFSVHPPHPPPVMHSLPCNPHHSPEGPLVTSDEPTLTHHNHPQSTAFSFTLDTVPSMGLDKDLWRRMNPPLWHHTEYVHCPKSLLCSASVLLQWLRFLSMVSLCQPLCPLPKAYYTPWGTCREEWRHHQRLVTGKRVRSLWPAKLGSESNWLQLLWKH